MSERVLLAITTYRRPAGLARLLEAVACLRVPPGVELSVAVIDNSPEGGALDTLGRLAPRYRLPLQAHHQPRQGLARARNTALEAGLADGFGWLSFIDDDEVPGPGWLAAHWRALHERGADASLGAVHAAYLATPPGWVHAGRFLEIRGFADGARLRFGATSNILFSLYPVAERGLRFDPAYDLTGGEDTAFFDAYRRMSRGIVFCAAAVVHETVPPERATLRWLWRRWRRTGQTNGQIWMARQTRLRRTACALGGLARIGGGLALALTGGAARLAGERVLWARGVRAVARGCGFVDAALGRRTLEYARLSR